MDQSTRRTLGWIAAAVAVAGIVIVILVLSRREVQPPAEPEPAPPALTAIADAGPADAGPADAGPGPAEQPPEPEPAPQVPDPNPEISGETAERLFKDGLKLSDGGKFVKARTALSEALFSGKLRPTDAARARDELRHLADTTILSRHAFAGDPYTFMHEFKAGDRLADKRRGGKIVPGLVTSLDLRVPARAIELANGTPAKEFKAGVKYKLIRGPFHAIVYRSIFAMDIYLQRDKGPKTFIRRLSVGLGKNGSTPLGSWQVSAKAGGRGTRAPWYPPPSSGLVGPIYPGDKNYAFGEKGLWIKIKGLDANTRDAQGYGIHSTGDQSSVGRQSSLGCIRLADGDIDFVFDHLYEGHSTVWIRP